MKTVKATVALHNWLKEEGQENEEDLPQVPPQANPGPNLLEPEAMRDTLADHFMSEEGEVPYQWLIVHRTSNN